VTAKFLSAENSLEKIEREITETLANLKTPPTLALLWVGDDLQTQKFVKAKQKMADKLGIEFQLHHFQAIAERQLQAVVSSLASNKKVTGIIVQLPLPKEIDAWKILQLIPPEKDVDNLSNGPFSSPTAEGIVEILTSNGVDLASKNTVILGAGKLVGSPLAEIFTLRKWPFQQIARDAENHLEEISTSDVLIAATGVANLVNSKMVNPKMVVVDGSGIDVDVADVQDHVHLLTPPKGAVGPMTVMLLMRNVTEAAKRQQGRS